MPFLFRAEKIAPDGPDGIFFQNKTAFFISKTRDLEIFLCEKKKKSEKSVKVDLKGFVVVGRPGNRVLSFGVSIKAAN